MVKLADLRHNSDVTRLGAVNDKMRILLEKYKTVIDLLNG